MGESADYVLKNEPEVIGETLSSNPIMEVSVSFGRFENDELSWEKWSTFSPNKYLEEVEKCATPGSVAQKKAYFEAHYKKIAARKAELLEQENQVENNQLKPFDENDEDLKNSSVENDPELVESRNQNSSDEIEQGIASNDEVNELNSDAVEEEVDCRLESEIPSIEEKEEEVDCRLESEIPSIEEKKEVDVESECSNTNKSEEPVVENEIKPPSPTIEDLHSCLDGEKTRTAPESKEKTTKSESGKESGKITPASKDKHSGIVKKKPVKTASKDSLITPRTCKANSTYVTPKTRSSTKNSIGSSLLRSKIPEDGPGRKVALKSLHMSLSLGSPNSHPASLNTARKSLIMEKMGDKEIVKRAFKAFQSSFNQIKSSPEDRSCVTKQIPSKGTEGRVSTSINTRKENGGSVKIVGVDKRNSKSVATSPGLKINERVDKQKKEFSKKLDKPSPKDSDRTCLRSKAKDQKDAEIKRLRQSLNFKATPMPAFYRTQKLSKNTSDKEVSRM